MAAAASPGTTTFDQAAVSPSWGRVLGCFAAAFAFALVTPGAAAAAPVWTAVASGTTDDISAIEYQADDRLFFTTKNGKIFRREGSTFVQRLNSPGVAFNDIELRGQIGIAVGNAGVVYRSTDGGAQWSPVAMPLSNIAGCSASAPLGDALKVAFANDTAVYVFGGPGQVMRSANAGATFANHNSTGPTGPCKSDLNLAISGAFFVPGALSPTGYISGGSSLWFTNNDFQSAQLKSSSLAIAFGKTRLAGDPANPNRQWTVELGVNSSVVRTEDGWNSLLSWATGNRQRREMSVAQDIAFNGGTVLMAGTAGMIMNSLDGRTFFFVDAAGPLAAQEWRSVGLMSASKGAVGGVGGTLALSDNVNTIPDIVAPTGTIAGPSAVTAGQPATFSAQATDEAGGSGLSPTAYAWTASGLPAQTGPSATFTFTSAGTRTISVVLIDNAGNKKEVSRSVVVNAATAPAPPPPPPSAPAVQKKSLTFPGGKITLSFPGRCVASNSSFKVRLAFKRSRRKGNVYVKVSSTRFFAQGRSVFFDRRAPFVAVIRVRRARPSTTYRLRAQATLKVRRGKPRRRSISATVRVC